MGFFLSPLINSRFLIKVNHRKKIFAWSIISMLAIFEIGYSLAKSYIKHKAIFFTFLFSSLSGLACSSLEATTLGFAKGIHQDAVEGWVTGTGFAGFVASFASFFVTWSQEYIGFFVKKPNLLIMKNRAIC